MDKVLSHWRRLSVGRKVVAPFVVLTLVVGLLVSAIATQQLRSSGAQQLETMAVREQDNVNTIFNSIEERQLADLRLLAATYGVADAVRAGQTGTLGRLLLPLVANHLPEVVDVTVVNAHGDGVLRLEADPQRPDQCVCTVGSGKASYAYLDDVLAGRADGYGTRYEALARDGSGWIFYTIGPIIDPSGYLAGAVVVSESLSQIVGLILERANVQLSLFTPGGTSLASTQRLDFPVPGLSPAERNQVVSQAGVLSKRVSAGGHQAAIFYVPLILRFQPAGYAALVVPADPVVGAEDLLLAVILVVALGALALTLLVGSIVARSITRPMQELIKATAEVSAGNLHHRAVVDPGDEIGHLAVSFNAMTSVLLERTQKLETLTGETLVTLAAAIDARDAYTHGHSMRVAMYADALATAYGYSLADRDAIRQGCTVHDIGKIGVADSILRKQRSLDAGEWSEMRQHPVIGHRLVSGLPWDRVILDIVLHHHERWDGRGYPGGLAADAIPHAARIVAIADTLDAMTSGRPYRPAHSFGRAADEIISEAGLQFDAELVAIFKTLTREFAPLVQGALHAWVPKVYQGRRKRSLAIRASNLEVVSSWKQR